MNIKQYDVYILSDSIKLPFNSIFNTSAISARCLVYSSSVRFKKSLGFLTISNPMASSTKTKCFSRLNSLCFSSNIKLQV